jgi:hypothetical protein
MSSLACKQCGQPIKFDDKRVSQRTGKKIPLDVDTQEAHNCPKWDRRSRNGQQQGQSQQQQGEIQQQQQQTQQEKRYYCNKGCGQEIYFDVNSKTESGRWIPLSTETRQPHQCQTNNNNIDHEEE